VDTTGFQPTDAESFAAVRDTLHTASACCDWIIARAGKAKTFGRFALHQLTYYDAREKFGLSAQIVARCIGNVCDACKFRKRVKRTFWADGAIPFDDRILTWKPDAASVRTVKGRLKIAFGAGPRQAELLKSRQGESDLILHKGVFFWQILVCPARTINPGRWDGDLTDVRRSGERAFQCHRG
jgi:hypothetical protein